MLTDLPLLRERVWSVTIIWTIHHENRETNIHPAGDRCTTAALHYNITVTSDSVLMSPVFMRHLHYNSGCIISRPSGLSWLYHKTAALEWPSDRSTSRWWYEEHLLMLIMQSFQIKNFLCIKDFCDIEFFFIELNHQEYKVNWNIWKESHKVFTEAENRKLMFCVGGQCWHSLASASLLLFLGGVGAVQLSVISWCYLFKYLDITHCLSVVVSNSVSLFWI